MAYIINKIILVRRSGKRTEIERSVMSVIRKSKRTVKEDILKRYDPWERDPVYDVILDVTEL